MQLSIKTKRDDYLEGSTVMIKVNKNKYYSKIVLIMFILFIFNGCTGDPSEEHVNNWIKETVSKCEGTVKDFLLIREGLLSNKFLGYAEITVKGINYYPDVIVYADYKGQFFYKMQQNPCEFSGLAEQMNSLKNMFE